MNRREFLKCAATAGAVATAGATSAKSWRDFEVADGQYWFHDLSGEPLLAAVSETSVAVSWAVGRLATGGVEIADNSEMRNARYVKCGEMPLAELSADSLQVRVEGLEPATRYWYRTITDEVKSVRHPLYAGISRGERKVGAVYSFTTSGAAGASRFGVINDTHAQWDSFAFYDKDGTYVNWGMTWNKNRVAPYYSGTTPTTSETGYRYRNLGPSEATFGRSDYGLNNSTFASLFSQGGSASFACYGINPASPSNPSTWVPIVFRMPKGSNAIVAFDYAPYAGASYLAVKAYTLEGSADGQHWYEVAKDGSFNYSHTLNNSQQWIYTQRGDNVSTEANTKKIRLLADGETKALEYTCETNDYSVLENVGVVTVANGATLKAEGDFTPEIRRLGIDAQTGAGTIDGFTLADGAEIFVTGTFPNEGFTVPVSFSGLGDVATATGLAVKDSTGKTRSWSVKLTETSATFAPSGIIISIR